MKTAQEILGGILPLSIWDSWDENLCNCPPHYIIEAMQQYAQQQSIAFYKYVNNERWVYSEGTDLWHLSQAHVPLTSSELYQQFLTE